MAYVRHCVALDRTRMQVEDKTVNVWPGTDTVEIKTGSRSILSYPLSRIVRYEACRGINVII